MSECVRVRVRERKKETEVHNNLNHASGQLVIKYLVVFCGSQTSDSVPLVHGLFL